MAREHHRYCGFAPHCRGRGRGSLFARVVNHHLLTVALGCRTSLNNPYRLQSRLAVIGGVRGNVQQNQFPSIRVLQLQTSGLNGLISAQEDRADGALRSEEHTYELQSLMRISYAVFYLNKKNTTLQKLQT